jgi:hypothetical protein
MAKFPCDRFVRSSNSAGSILDLGGTRGERVPLRFWLIGQPEHVQGTIKNLHVREFAEPHEWTKPMEWSAIVPVTQTQMLTFAEGSVISICTRYLS